LGSGQAGREVIGGGKSGFGRIASNEMPSEKGKEVSTGVGLKKTQIKGRGPIGRERRRLIESETTSEGH